jgi:hypothetical protein
VHARRGRERALEAAERANDERLERLNVGGGGLINGDDEEKGCEKNGGEVEHQTRDREGDGGKERGELTTTTSSSSAGLFGSGIVSKRAVSFFIIILLWEKGLKQGKIANLRI